MRKYFTFLTIFLFLLSCGQKENAKKTFKSLTDVEKEKIIKDNIIDYANQNKNETAFNNYFFLLDQENKLKPCPNERYKSIKTYFKDQITAELSLYPNSTYEYLTPDKELGELGTYGIQFIINDTSGAVETFSAYANFTKWGKGEIGSRENNGSKFQNFKKNNIPNIQKTYGDKDLMAKVDQFFETEMKQQQLDNRAKCK